jgi:uncharacterized membrane protein
LSRALDGALQTDIAASSGMNPNASRRVRMKKAAMTGTMLATSVAIMFLATPIRAADNPSAGSSVKCVGGNSCKGQSACKSESHGCAGQNSCKGKGWVLMSSAKQCKDAGGKPETPTED